jgi:O-antigen/teichoic acid export membrane protein
MDEPPDTERNLATRLFGGGAVRRVVTNSGWTLAATGVAATSVFVETVLLARYLSPSGYGVFLLVIAFPEAVQQLLDFRVREGMTKYLSGFLAKGQLREAVAVVKLLWILEVAVTAIAFLIVVVTAGLAAKLILSRPDLAHLMVIYGAGLFFAAFDTASGTILRVLDRFALSFGTAAAAALVRLAAVILVIASGWGLEALVIARVIAEAIGTAIMGAVALRALARVVWKERHAPMRVLRGQFREIAFFLVNTNLVGTVRAAATKLDTILVGLLATPAAVSVYKVAIQFGTGPLLLGDALLSAVYPRFAGSYATGDRGEIRHIAARMSALVAALAIPAGIAFAVVGGDIAGAIFGGYYQAVGLPGTLCLIGTITYVIFFWVQPLILAAGRAGALLRIVTVATVTQFGVLILLVKPFGAAGATAALGSAYLLAAVLQLWYVRRRRLLEDEPAAGESTPEDGGDLEIVGAGPSPHPTGRSSS